MDSMDPQDTSGKPDLRIICLLSAFDLFDGLVELMYDPCGTIFHGSALLEVMILETCVDIMQSARPPTTSNSDSTRNAGPSLLLLYVLLLQNSMHAQ